jgi:Polyketide cyclase / dehydrase and lipid transport
MPRIEFQLDIKAPIDEVYHISQDYAVRYKWDSFPENITMLNGANKVEKGVRVLVTAKSGLKMEVEFVQVLPPTTAAIKMTKGPFFLQSFSGSWVFRTNSLKETNAKFIYSIESKKWALPWVSDHVVTWYFSRVIKSRLSGLKNYCEENAY